MYHSMRMSLSYFQMLPSHCNSALQYVAAFCSVLRLLSSDIQSFSTRRDKHGLFDAPHGLNYFSMLVLLQQYVAVCCSVVQCVAVVGRRIFNRLVLKETKIDYSMHRMT